MEDGTAAEDGWELVEVDLRFDGPWWSPSIAVSSPSLPDEPEEGFADGTTGLGGWLGRLVGVDRPPEAEGSDAGLEAAGLGAGDWGGRGMRDEGERCGRGTKLKGRPSGHLTGGGYERGRERERKSRGRGKRRRRSLLSISSKLRGDDALAGSLAEFPTLTPSAQPQDPG